MVPRGHEVCVKALHVPTFVIYGSSIISSGAVVTSPVWWAIVAPHGIQVVVNRPHTVGLWQGLISRTWTESVGNGDI